MPFQVKAEKGKREVAFKALNTRLDKLKAELEGAMKVAASEVKESARACSYYSIGRYSICNILAVPLLAVTVSAVPVYLRVF